MKHHTEGCTHTEIQYKIDGDCVVDTFTRQQFFVRDVISQGGDGFNRFNISPIEQFRILKIILGEEAVHSLMSEIFH